jgi:hypothetical protein
MLVQHVERRFEQKSKWTTCNRSAYGGNAQDYKIRNFP